MIGSPPSKKKVRVLWVYPNIPLSTILPLGITLLDSYLKGCKDLEVESEVFETTYYQQDGISSEDWRVKLGQILPSKSIHEYFGGMDKAIQDFQKKVLEYQPDIIGVSCTDFTHKIGERLVNGHREWYKKPHVCCVGGIFASFAYDYLLDFGQYDVVQRFEGFRSMEYICKHWDGDLSQCPNAAFRVDGKTVLNPLAAPVDIETLPFPNYDLFPRWRMQRPMGGKLYSMYNILDSLGCAGQCAICCAPTIFKSYKNEGHCYLRVKSADRIMEELKWAKEHYDVKYFYFSSETFMLGNKQKFREFMERYRDEIHLPFWCEARVAELLQEDYAKILKNAGIDRISVGLESGNEEYRRKVMHKAFTNDQFHEAVRRTRAEGVKMTINAVLGCPDETRETVFDTIKTMKSVAEGDPGISLSASVFCPCYGSQFRQIAVEKGYFDPKAWDNMDWNSFHMTQIALDNPGFPAKEVQGIYKCFTLYTKMPYEYWDDIKKAESDDAEFERLMKIYNEKYRNVG